ncbi:Snaclec coagulation factor X-activating enzyme light chain 1 [Exaiptasia diaphana]|nr:Snaclec coagulation factor X-activating enzyme light chain 1 [Exaiptasia diaphana]
MAKKTLLLLALVLMNNVMLFAQSKNLPLVKKSFRRRHVTYLPCPNDWVSYKGSPSCYKVPRRLTNSWFDARKSCIAMGSDLVKISSDQENDFVALLAHSYFPVTTHLIYQAAWIGLISG